MFSYVRSLCSAASVSDGAGWTGFSLMSQLRRPFYEAFKEFYFQLSPEICCYFYLILQMFYYKKN